MAEPETYEANALVESKLHECIRALETKLEADVLAFSGPIYANADLFIRDAIEWRRRQRAKRRKLAFFLETSGGFIEITQRIATIIRRYYKRIEFFVPDAAMSAGTVLVMSGDRIHMDYYSVLGPIDPQVPKADGGYLPALGYLKKYKELMDKADKGSLNTAEVTYLCTKFDPAMLYQYEHARQLSVYLLEQWLTKYKFRDWKRTQRRKLTVTLAMKKARAKEIADILNDTETWHSHGHGISMAVLRSRRIKLQIEDFGEDKDLSRRIRDYWALLSDHMAKVGAPGVIHANGWYKHLRW